MASPLHMHEPGLACETHRDTTAMAGLLKAPPDHQD